VTAAVRTFADHDPGAAAVLTDRLTKSYGRQRSRGVVDLDLEVRTGEVFGFLGPNGAGKTTTIRVLLDLIRPTAGRAIVLGRDSRRETLAIQARSGYLPGELML
jgi:ABC-2 type transport system ATP-binding protein